MQTWSFSEIRVTFKFTFIFNLKFSYFGSKNEVFLSFICASVLLKIHIVEYRNLRIKWLSERDDVSATTTCLL